MTLRADRVGIRILNIVYARFYGLYTKAIFR
jgi:hypothetical protein